MYHKIVDISSAIQSNSQFIWVRDYKARTGELLDYLQIEDIGVRLPLSDDYESNTFRLAMIWMKKVKENGRRLQELCKFT